MVHAARGLLLSLREEASSAPRPTWTDREDVVTLGAVNRSEKTDTVDSRSTRHLKESHPQGQKQWLLVAGRGGEGTRQWGQRFRCAGRGASGGLFHGNVSTLIATEVTLRLG